MPRPKNKTELQSLSQANYARLLSLIDSYSDEEQRSAFPEGTTIRRVTLDEALARVKDGLIGEEPSPTVETGGILDAEAPDRPA